MKRLRTGGFCFVFVVAAAVVGCGGGGGAGSPVPAASPGAGTSAVLHQAQVALHVAPATTTRAVRRAYLPSTTKSVSIIVTSSVAASPLPAVTVNIPSGCSTASTSSPSPSPSASGGYDCIITVQAYIGSDTFTINAYDGLNGSGNLLSTGSVQSTVPASQPVGVTLGGIIKALQLQIVQNSTVDPYVPIGGSATLVVHALDASGSVIVGTYDNPVSITAPGSSAGYQLAGTSVTGSKATPIPLTWPGAPLYNNASRTSSIISATVDGITGSVTVHPASALVSVTAAPTSAPYLLNMAVDGNGNVYDDLAWYSPAQNTLVELSPQSGNVTRAQLPFRGGNVYADRFNNIWLADGNDSPAALYCLTSVGASPKPIPFPSFAPDPFNVTEDVAGNLWFDDWNFHNLLYTPDASNCAVNAVNATALPLPAPSAYPFVATADFASDPDGSVWVVDQDGPYAFTANAGQPSPAATLVPYPGTQAPQGFAAAGTAFYTAAVDNTNSNVLFGTIPANSILPAEAGALSVPSILWPSSAEGIAATGSGTSAKLAYMSGANIMVLYDPGANAIAPAQIPLGTISGSCANVVFSNGEPWTACTDNINTYFEHLILAEGWNLFYDPNGQGFVGIAGGASSTTFTYMCGATIQCTQTGPRAIQVYSQTPATGTVTVTGSNGEVKTLTVSLTGSPISGLNNRRRSASACGWEAHRAAAGAPQSCR